MTLNLDLDGILVRLRIDGYHPSGEEDWTGEWCVADFSFRSAPWLDYSRERDEVFLCREVEELFSALNALLTDEQTEERVMALMEPDFTFKLHPKRDLRGDPKVTYVPKGHEIEDISMEWLVSFWQDGLTANYLSVTLDRKEVGYLRNYLGLVSGRVRGDAPEIAAMLRDGTLTGETYCAETRAAFEELDHGGGHWFGGTTEQLFRELEKD